VCVLVCSISCFSFVLWFLEHSKTGVEIDVGAQPPQPDPVEEHDKLLIVGWSDNIRGMLMVLDNLFDPGTEVHLLNR